ncbi:outer membrane vitamin B12 receptor BtuB [Methylophaga lonarensis MPL]|uniref:Outer membrane vitamin B12 receptor BtuB n=1 Tax=Methylophaga lonarensis MPL TaxID=1286106 RepID=M7NYP7_9GAMM|nr:TonB-dependent receptor [Methylophaga lonarensis]EMR13963.1 outer membrane vitamin B12 receptor BtuB [Methylophaga lonarensis MPL]
MKPSTKAMPLRVCARLTLAALATSAFTVPAHAEHQSFDPITVTANRMPTDNALAPHSVISRADIERLQIHDLPTLLARFPGIDMNNSGGLGKASSIYMRGTNAGHVLVLVDGVKWHSATSGTTSLQDFPVNQIERIEIVRGPRSGLYGSEAIGGVIQIFTRQGRNQSPTPYASVGFGKHNTKQASGGVSGGNESTRYHLNFSHLSTDGIDARVNANPDRDGYRNNSLSARISHDVTDRWSVGANFLRTQSRNEYDSLSPTADFYADNVQQVLGVNTSVQLTDSWLMALNLSESRDEGENFRDRQPDGTFNTRHRYASLVNTFVLTPQHTLNIGLDYDHDRVVSSTDYQEDSRDNKAVFVSWQGHQDRHNWLLSVRHDDNQAFGEKTTGTADWGYQLTQSLQIVANVGTGFKAPTFNQLYWPDTPGFIGNPDLKPEKSKNYGIGLMGNANWGSWGLHAYQNKVRDLLVYQFPTTENVDEAKITGLEFDLATTLLDWQIQFNASVLKPKDETTGNILPRRAQRMANLHLDRQFGNWLLGGSWKVTGHRFDDAANNTRLSGYEVVDFRLAYQIDSDWSVKLNAMNVFDRDYQTVNNFNSLGRTYMLSLHYQP